MGAYKNVSNELKTYFYSHGIFKILLPLDLVFIIGGLVVMVLNEFVSVGGFLYSLAYYLFLLGLLLTYANFNQRMLYIGFFTYGAIQLLNVLQGIFTKYSYLNYHALFTALIFGWIGFVVFKRDAITEKSK